MTDLVTRLRALADEAPSTWVGGLCRGAADALAEAEAEAAALREAAQAWLNAADQAAGRAPVSQEDAHRLMYAVMDAAEACRSTLSQPGPGAALLERVKKLEAVAEAARTWADMMPASDLTKVLAALEEKP